MSDEAERFVRVSVLFSEPKIPQLLYPQRLDLTLVVSVLFSEPKIPQHVTDFGEAVALVGFSALQRAENSSIHQSKVNVNARIRVSVLFSEPKIPQSCEGSQPRSLL